MDQQRFHALVRAIVQGHDGTPGIDDASPPLFTRRTSIWRRIATPTARSTRADNRGVTQRGDWLDQAARVVGQAPTRRTLVRQILAVAAGLLAGSTNALAARSANVLPPGSKDRPGPRAESRYAPEFRPLDITIRAQAPKPCSTTLLAQCRLPVAQLHQACVAPCYFDFCSSTGCPQSPTSSEDLQCCFCLGQCRFDQQSGLESCDQQYGCSPGQICQTDVLRQTPVPPGGLDGLCCHQSRMPCNGACVDPSCPGRDFNPQTCRCECAQGRIECNGVCIDPSTDANHCGQCGRVCIGGKVCRNGVCACPAGRTDCAGSCRDLTTDQANCGACGAVCSSASGMTCQAGACRCRAGWTDCNGRCKDLQRDRLNCGACGTVCPAWQTCCAGICAVGNTPACCGQNGDTCPTSGGPWDCCPSAWGPYTCTKLDTFANCGRCAASGGTCKGGKQCVASGCTPGESRCCRCPSTKPHECNGICTSIQTDLNNCGACGKRCAPSATCIEATGDCVTITPVACQSGTCICPAGSYDCHDGCFPTTEPVCCPLPSAPYMMAWACPAGTQCCSAGVGFPADRCCPVNATPPALRCCSTGNGCC